MQISSTPRTISEPVSIYMDTLRILAAITVFYGHAYAQWFTTKGYNYDGIDWGHVSVVVFFALSGYVIAHTTTGNNRGPSLYAQSRLSRLSSVVIPTLLVTALIEILVKFLDPALLMHYTRGLSWPRYLLSGLYLNEIWFFSASPPINGPLWSLSFEFWYYVIFGCFFYRTKNWISIAVIIVACLIAGPKILAMMPIWILGNLAYRIQNSIKSKTTTWTIVFISFSIAIVMAVTLPSLPFHLGRPPLFFAGQFITDFIVGIFMAISLWALPAGYGKPRPAVSANKAMVFLRKFADLTFPLYVLHDPLLVLFRSIWKTKLFDGFQMGIGIISVFIACIILGYLMEEKRDKWVALFKSIFSKGEKILVPTSTNKV